jgi:hypothetical protein
MSSVFRAPLTPLRFLERSAEDVPVEPAAETFGVPLTELTVESGASDGEDATTCPTYLFRHRQRRTPTTTRDQKQTTPTETGKEKTTPIETNTQTNTSTEPAP